MKPMDILILEPEDYSKTALKLYRSIGRVYLWPRLSYKQRLEIKKTVHILVVRLGYYINKAWLDSMPNLKVVVTPTTGLNHIEVKQVLSKGIKILSLRGRVSFLKNITSTAELALGLIIALARNLPNAFEDVKQGRWDRMSFRGHQLSGKTLGLIGYGRLGKLVAKYGKVLGMKVVAHDPYVKLIKGVDFISLENLLRTADIVSLHALLTEKNCGFIGLKHFRLMKPTAYFINTARAELVEKYALYKALSQKMIAGAAIDVMDNESADSSHLEKDSLWKYAKTHHNLIITPHIGGATFEAMHITEEYVANLVKNYIKNKKLS